MNSTKDLLHQISDANLSNNQRAQVRCELARQLEEAGNFEGAREAMRELWQRVGERPLLEGLDQETEAEVLLRAGALTGWIGSAKQIEGAQQLAKDLISESVRLFETTAKKDKVAIAQTDLALCYWREGAFDNARVILQEALSKLPDEDYEVKAVALLRSAIVEKSAGRYHDALRIHMSAEPLFDKSNNFALKGKFHHLFGFILKKLGGAEKRPDYIDRALIEYAAASSYWEQAGLSRFQGCVENNLGFLYGTIGRFIEAHEHLDRAQALFTTLKDNVHLAQVDETRARVMLAEGRIADAQKMVRAAVRTLEKGGEQSLLAEALTTQGIVLARLGQLDQARVTLHRAVEVAERAGDPESAGQAALVMVEQLGAFLSNEDLCTTIERAEELLKNTQDMSTLRRLAQCAGRVVSVVQAFPASIDWTNFSFKRAVRRYEAHLIALALKDAGGLVTRAARLLGLSGHQSLVAMLKHRHQELSEARSPVVPRARSIVRANEADAKRDETLEEREE